MSHHEYNSFGLFSPKKKAQSNSQGWTHSIIQLNITVKSVGSSGINEHLMIHTRRTSGIIA